MVLPFDDPGTIPILDDCLKSGGIAVIPCDTIYGIVGRVPDTEKKIKAAKGRGEDNPFLQLAPDTASVMEISLTPIPESISSLWPGPVTLIIEDTTGAGRALRVPSDLFLQMRLEKLGTFLYSTSVNLSGEPHLNVISDIIKLFNDRVDLIVDKGNLPSGMPSTLLDIREKPYKILRRGEIEIPDELLNLT